VKKKIMKKASHFRRVRKKTLLENEHRFRSFLSKYHRDDQRQGRPRGPLRVPRALHGGSQLRGGFKRGKIEEEEFVRSRHSFRD